jgi:hypothetical protein
MNKNLLILLAATAAVAACGGGGGNDSPAVTDTVPPAATASPQAYTGFVGSLAADDTGEPLKLDGVLPPASDTDEPAPLR